jgi:hypothetical protein
MKRFLLALLAVLMLTGLSCATYPDEEEVWPDEEAIRDNANDSMRGLKRAEKKHR